MCICLAAGGVGGVGGECIRVFDLGLVLGWVGLREVGGEYDVCVCVLVEVVWVEWVVSV